MSLVKKQIDIENDIQVLKNSNNEFHKKLIFNT